jgi:hypothetical protein
VCLLPPWPSSRCQRRLGPLILPSPACHSFSPPLSHGAQRPGQPVLPVQLSVRCSAQIPAVAEPAAAVAAGPACLLAVVAEGAASPLQGEPWEAVMAHMAQRLLWTDPTFVMDLSRTTDLDAPLHPPPGIVVVVGVHDSALAQRVVARFAGVPTLVALDCGPEVEAAVRVGGSFQHQRSALATLLARLPWGPERSRRQLAATIGTAWGRQRADDVLFGLLLLIDALVRPVPQLAGLRAQDLGTLQRMATKCGPQIWACLTDESCQQALDCLNACPPNDQVGTHPGDGAAAEEKVKENSHTSLVLLVLGHLLWAERFSGLIKSRKEVVSPTYHVTVWVGPTSPHPQFLYWLTMSYSLTMAWFHANVHMYCDHCQMCMDSMSDM